jgi:hypothetical protein
MPSIFDWSTTSSSNVSINGVSVAENCPAANINNAIREMAAVSRSTFASGLQNFLAGTSPLAVASGGTGLSAALTTNALVKQGASNFAASIVSDDGSTATVTGALSATGAGAFGGYISTASNAFVATGSGYWLTGASSFTTGMSSASTGTALTLYTGSTERVRIDSIGNVGIGTSSPNAKLDVVGNIWSRPGGSSGAVAMLTADASSGANGIVLDAGFASGGYGPIRLSTSATDRMVITAAGNVGIGTSSPLAKLNVQGSGDAYIQVGASGTATNNYHFGGDLAGSFILYQGNYGAGLERLRVTSSAFSVYSGVMSLTSAGSLTSASLADAVGYKGAPNSNPTTGSAITLTAAQMGKRTPNTSGGWVVPASLPADGVWILHNNSSSTQTITASGTTLTLQGTTTTGTRTVAPNGLATVTQIDSSNSFLVGGNVT